MLTTIQFKDESCFYSKEIENIMIKHTRSAASCLKAHNVVNSTPYDYRCSVLFPGGGMP